MDRTTRIKLFTLLGLVVLVIGAQIIGMIRAQYTVVNFPPHGKNVVAFGDSLTEGVGASSPEHGYVGALSARLGTPIINKGVSGDTTEMALARIDEVTALSPDIVLLFLGGNDILRKLPEAETLAHLRTIIDTLQGKGATVILIGFKGILGDAYHDAYSDLARETGCLFVPDALDGVLGEAEFMADEVHPNDAGYLRVADRIAPVLEGVLAAVDARSAQGVETSRTLPSSE